MEPTRNNGWLSSSSSRSLSPRIERASVKDGERCRRFGCRFESDNEVELVDFATFLLRYCCVKCRIETNYGSNLRTVRTSA